MRMELLLQSCTKNCKNFLSPESKQALRGAWERANTGISNSAKVAILDAGIELQNITMPIKRRSIY